MDEKAAGRVKSFQPKPAELVPKRHITCLHRHYDIPRRCLPRNRPKQPPALLPTTSHALLTETTSHLTAGCIYLAARTFTNMTTFEPILSASMRASSHDAPSMADQLPSINFGFDDLRSRMNQFTARFDDFIEKGRRRVLEERNQFRMNVAEVQGMLQIASTFGAY